MAEAAHTQKAAAATQPHPNYLIAEVWQFIDHYYARSYLAIHLPRTINREVANIHYRYKDMSFNLIISINISRPGIP